MSLSRASSSSASYGVQVPANIDAGLRLAESASVDHWRGAARGTVVHEALQRLALVSFQYPAEHASYVEALFAAMSRLRPARLLGSEVVVGSARHLFGGTFDALVEDHAGRRILIDLKTNASGRRPAR